MLAVDTGTILNFLQSIPTRPDRLTTGEQALVKATEIIIGVITGEVSLAKATSDFMDAISPLSDSLPIEIPADVSEPSFFQDDDPEPNFLKNVPVLLYIPEPGVDGRLYLPDVDPFKVYGKDINRDQQ